MMPFERLKAWHLSHRLTLEVYRASEGWPKRELYGLTSQIRRAAVSVSASIAEGAAKRGRTEFGRCLDIALGSFSELTYLLRLSLDLGLMTDEQSRAVEAVRAEAGKVIWGLYRRIRPKVAAKFLR